MPAAAPRVCTSVGCQKLVSDGSGRCEKHPRPAWSKRPDAPKRTLTGRPLQRERKRIFQQQPLCVLCRKVGHIRAATELDHIIPLSQGGTDEPANLQGLCGDCHKEKTANESRAGHPPTGG